MYHRLLQAVTITLLLNLLAHISQPAVNHSSAISPSHIASKPVVSFR